MAVGFKVLIGNTLFDLDEICEIRKPNDEGWPGLRYTGIGGTSLSNRYTRVLTQYPWNVQATEIWGKYRQDGADFSIAKNTYAPSTHLRFSLTSPGTYYLSRSGTSLILTGTVTSTLTFPNEAPRYLFGLGVGGGAGGSGGNSKNDGVGGQAGGGCLFYMMVPDSPNAITMGIGTGGAYDGGSAGDEVHWSEAGTATYVNYGGYQITMNGGGNTNNVGNVTYPSINSVLGAMLAVTGSTGTYGTGNGVTAQWHATGVGGSLGWNALPGGPDPGGGGGGGSSIFAIGGTGGNSSSGKPGSYGSGGGGGSNKFLNGQSGASGGNGRIDIFY